MFATAPLSSFNGLSCSVALTKSSKTEGEFVFILTNIIRDPIKITNWANPSLGTSSELVRLHLLPEFWMSDAPSMDYMSKSLVVIQPRESFAYPINVGKVDENIPVEVG